MINVIPQDSELEADLRRIVRGEVRPAFRFQPIADLRRNVVAGYEALVRLPVRAGLPPDLCLQAAGRFGMQGELETLITAQALEARQTLPKNVFLSINVSPAFLCSRAWEHVCLPGADLGGLVVEITEGECIEDYEEIRGRVAEIIALGGMVAIDDAGAGYASLKHILELKPSFIKLDRSFVHDCGTDRAKSTMIELLGAAASRMDAWVITEGVETPAELGELMRLGVPLAQGYFLGRPQPSMEGLTSEAVSFLETFSARQSACQKLLLYAEACPGVLTRAKAKQILSEEQPLVALVDQWGRPLEMFEHHSLLGPRMLSGSMRSHFACDVREALQRALTRHPAIRFDPILLTDDEGRLRGVVRVDRLMRAVLDADEGGNLL